MLDNCHKYIVSQGIRFLYEHTVPITDTVIVIGRQAKVSDFNWINLHSNAPLPIRHVIMIKCSVSEKSSTLQYLVLKEQLCIPLQENIDNVFYARDQGLPLTLTTLQAQENHSFHTIKLSFYKFLSSSGQRKIYHQESSMAAGNW